MNVSPLSSRIRQAEELIRHGWIVREAEYFETAHSADAVAHGLPSDRRLQTKRGLQSE